MTNRDKTIDWICKDYITNIKENDWPEKSWYYVIEKAFGLHSMTLPELKKFKIELTKED